MKTFECIIHNGMTGKQSVFIIRSVNATDAGMAALEQAKAAGTGIFSIASVKEM